MANASGDNGFGPLRARLPDCTVAAARRRGRGIQIYLSNAAIALRHANSRAGQRDVTRVTKHAAASTVIDGSQCATWDWAVPSVAARHPDSPREVISLRAETDSSIHIGRALYRETSHGQAK